MRYLVRCAAAAALVSFPGLAWSAPAPAYQWSGLYGGAQVGYDLGGMADIDVDKPYPDPWRYGSEGGFGGLFAGYNHAFGNWVGGLEVEGNLGSLIGHYDDKSYGGPMYTQNWSAAERVRLGFLANPSTLFYGSIGLAQGNVDLSRGYFAYEDYDAPNKTVNGVQVGAGVEAFVTPNLSVRVEGAYTHYGAFYTYYEGESESSTEKEKLDTFAARVGIAYHPGWLGGPTTALTSPPVGRSWAGVYVGGQIGAMMLNDPEDYNPNSNQTPYDPGYAFASGVSAGGGAYAGYNWQTGNLVAGIEADAELPGLSAPYDTEVFVKHDWSLGVRGRLGVVTAGNTLLYATLGWTAGHFDYPYFTASSSYYSGVSFTDSGLQVGIGAEAFLSSQLSMRLETVYTRYGTHDIMYEDSPYWNVTPDTLEARVGLSYHLN